MIAIAIYYIDLMLRLIKLIHLHYWSGLDIDFAASQEKQW